MNKQQLNVADAGRIVTRDLAPLRKFSFFKEGLVAWGLVSLLIFILIWTLLGTASIKAEWPFVTAMVLGGFGYYLLHIYAFAALYAWKPFAAARRLEAEKALNAVAVHPLLHWDADVGRAETGQVCWATGMGWDGQFLYMLDKGVGARIPPSMVREWRWVANRAGTTGLIGTGGISQTLAAQHEVNEFNALNHQRVKADNGLFVSVRDVDRPTWHFQTSDERILRKWDELLSQVFEERASASSSKETGTAPSAVT